MGTDADMYIVYRGRQRSIEYAVRARRSMPAKEFFEELPIREQHRLFALFQRMGDRGRILNKEQFKHVEGNIWEFKRGQFRMPCFQVAGRWILTHGFIKKRRKWRRTELDRAERIRREHLEREAQEGAEE